MMGYPLGQYYDKENNLPVMRMVWSQVCIQFLSRQPLFLVDARLHKGTSGSPVLTKEKSTWIGANGDTVFGVLQSISLELILPPSLFQKT